MRENSPHGLLTGARRYGIGDDDVAMFVPERQVVCRQHGRIGLDFPERVSDLVRVIAPGLGRIDARDLRGGRLACRGGDPALKLLEGRRALSHILHRLLETDAERMEHKAIEMELGRVVVPSSIPGVRPGFPEAPHTEHPGIVHGVQIGFQLCLSR